MSLVQKRTPKKIRKLPEINPAIVKTKKHDIPKPKINSASGITEPLELDPSAE